MAVKNTSKTIAFPHPPGSGGPGSFQIRFEKELVKQGWTICYAKDKCQPDLIFIVGGTRKLFWLTKMTVKGIPIIYRLDGINWLHKKKKVSLKNFILAEYRNWSNKFIHLFFANHIVYQSKFVKLWWDDKGWRKAKKYSIIHNGVDLQEFSPFKHNRKEIVLLCLEGTLDYSPYALRLLNELRENLSDDIPMEIYGRFENEKAIEKLDSRIQYQGSVPRNQVAEILKGCIYLSLDVNPACPNTVIEALASGSPVVAYNTGALPELVNNKAGLIVPYGSNPWELGYPDVNVLAEAVIEVYENFKSYSKEARKLSENRYSIESVFCNYMQIINKYL